MSIETPQSAIRLNNIQALRGIAALLVVLSHLFLIERKYSPDQLLGDWASFGFIGVDLFFVVSGFIMVHVAWNYRRGINACLEFLLARASRIYPLYWLVSIAVLLIWLIRPEIVFTSFDSQPNIWKSFALWPDSRAPLLTVGWTLVHEIFFYLIFALALLMRPKYLLPFLTIWVLILSLGIFGKFARISPLFSILFNPMSYEFLCGAFAGWVYKKYSGPFGIKTFALGLASLAIILLYVSQKNTNALESYSLRALYFSVPLTLIVYGQACMPAGRTIGMRALTRIGDWSYSLYLTHILSLSFAGRLWKPLVQHGLWDNIIALTISLGFALFISSLCWGFAEQLMLKQAKHFKKKLFSPPP